MLIEDLEAELKLFSDKEEITKDMKVSSVECNSDIIDIDNANDNSNGLLLQVIQ